MKYVAGGDVLDAVVAAVDERAVAVEVVGAGITPNARASATMAIVPVERRAPTRRGTVTMGAQLSTRPR